MIHVTKLFMVTNNSNSDWLDEIDFLHGQFLDWCVTLSTWNSWRCSCTCRKECRSAYFHNNHNRHQRQQIQPHQQQQPECTKWTGKVIHVKTTIIIVVIINNIVNNNVPNELAEWNKVIMAIWCPTMDIGRGRSQNKTFLVKGK